MQNEYNRFNLELDSLIITNMILNMDTSNLKLRKLIKDTSKIIQEAEVIISHCYREANQVADFLAKMASSIRTSTFYHSFQQLSLSTTFE